MSQDREQRGASQPIVMVVLLVLILAVAAWFYLTPEPQPETPETPPEPVATAPVEPTLPPQPLPTEPVPEPEPELEPEITLPPDPEPVQLPEPEPLPPLDDSDAFAKAELVTIADGMQIGDALVDDNLVRRFSVFVDNLANGEVMRKQGPFTPLADPFTAVELNGRFYLDPDGYRRYDKYANFLDQIEADALVSHFERVEPLLDTAFAELGYGSGEFRNSMQRAIDEMLAAPEFETPIELTSESVNYKYADEQLEGLSDVQKMMIRMGPDNARKVKAVLRQFKQRL